MAAESSRVWLKNFFILQGQLDGTLSNPTAPDFVHIFFSSLGMVSSSKLISDSFLHLNMNTLCLLPPFFHRWCLSILQTCLPLWSLPCWQWRPCGCWVRPSTRRRTSCGGLWEKAGTSPSMAAFTTHMPLSLSHKACYRPIYSSLIHLHLP